MALRLEEWAILEPGCPTEARHHSDGSREGPGKHGHAVTLASAFSHKHSVKSMKFRGAIKELGSR